MNNAISNLDYKAIMQLAVVQFGDMIMPGYGIVVIHNGEFYQWGEPVKITDMADLGIVVLDRRCIGASIYEHDSVFVLYREAIALIVERYTGDAIVSPIAKRIRMSPIKLGATQFRELGRKLNIRREQLVISEIGGILFRIAFRVEDINYACETTARNEQSAFLCVGFGR